jgi:hypothetical protein
MKNSKQTEVRKCLLSRGAESFVFQFAIQKYTYINTYRTTILPVVLHGCEKGHYVKSTG